jgi:hypothetical protein
VGNYKKNKNWKQLRDEVLFLKQLFDNLKTFISVYKTIQESGESTFEARK